MGRFAAALSLGLVFALAACHRAMAPAKSGEAKGAEDAALGRPTSIEGAAENLDQAERQIHALIEGRASPAPRSPGDRDGVDLSGGAGEPCATACRALASMERAATHLCELAGEGERCDEARTRVKSASERVHGACPICAAE